MHTRQDFKSNYLFLLFYPLQSDTIYLGQNNKKNIILKRKKMFFIIFALLFCLSLETCKSLHDSKLNNNIWYQNLDNFSLNTTNTWCEFDLNHEALEEHTCAWIGSITFKSKNAFKLKRLNLKWTGKYINTNNISASLYQKKDRDNLLLPIEKNHISDGIWDKNKQQIIFDLNEKLV